MAKLIRMFPVVGEENVLTSAGLITFLNGEAEIPDDQAESFQGISDVRVRYGAQAPQAVSAPTAEETAILQAEADAEKQRLADIELQRQADILQAAADVEKQRVADEAKQAEVTQDTADVAKAVDETAPTESAQTVSTPPPVSGNKKLPPAVK